jgi:hypothetical protein
MSEEEARRLAYKKVNGKWVDNPATVPFNPADVPDKLSVVIEFKPDPKRSEEAETRRRLKAEAIANRKFKEASSYMYIFGRGQYFELDVGDMVNADEKSGIIFRPLEKAGVIAVLDRMVKVNFTKQILTVMPDTKTRPTCWKECTAAGPLKIINGQHTWMAAKEIISGETSVNDAAIVEKMRKWTCEIVWSDNKDHLHALSCKCKDRNITGPYLSLLPAAIMHCHHLWENANKPSQHQKNARASQQEEMHKSYEVCSFTTSDHTV